MDTAQGSPAPIITPGPADLDRLRGGNPDVELHRLHARPNLPDEIIVRPPTAAEWRLYKSIGFDQTKRPDAAVFLVKTCAVSPDAAAVTAILNRHPGLADIWSNELAEIAGVLEGTHREKL